MSRLIDVDKLIDDLIHFAPEHYTALINMLIVKQPQVDAVEVIRCGQCKYQDKSENESGSWNCCTIGYCDVEDDYFCWWAERKQDDKC